MMKMPGNLDSQSLLAAGTYWRELASMVSARVARGCQAPACVHHARAYLLAGKFTIFFRARERNHPTTVVN